MLIECILRGEVSPHIITMHGDTYKFVNDEADSLVCDIMHKEHIDRLLHGTEGAYQVYGDEARAEHAEMLAQKELDSLETAQIQAKASLAAAQMGIKTAKDEADKRREQTAKGASEEAQRAHAAGIAAAESAAKKEAAKTKLRKES